MMLVVVGFWGRRAALGVEVVAVPCSCGVVDLPCCPGMGDGAD